MHPLFSAKQFPLPLSLHRFQLMEPEEMVNPAVDEQSMMTYLAQYPKSKPVPDAPLKKRGKISRCFCGNKLRSIDIWSCWPCATAPLSMNRRKIMVTVCDKAPELVTQISL